MAKYKYGTIRKERPDLVGLLFDQSLADKIHIMSGKRVDWVCPKCNSVLNKTVNKVVAKGLSCGWCGDGISRAEKIVASILKQSDIQYEPQKIFSWLPLKRYDFYLYEYDTIIEVHGSQHYGLGFEHLSGKTLENQQNIDRQKRSAANNNGILHYIEIDAQTPSASLLIPQIKEHFENAGIPFNADISKCELAATNSNVALAAELWNEGMWSSQISKNLGVSVSTAIDYLKRASTIGLCDYSPELARMKRRQEQEKVKNRGRPVKCVQTGEVFKSLASACRKYNITSASNIIRSCCSDDLHAGELNGIKLKWEYCDELR